MQRAGDGNYPDVVTQTLGSILPPLTDADKQLIKGSADFFAIDAYRTDISRAALGGIDSCIQAGAKDPRWPGTFD